MRQRRPPEDGVKALHSAMVRRTSIGFAYSQHQHSSVRYRKQPFRWYVEPSLFGDDDRLELEGTISECRGCFGARSNVLMRCHSRPSQHSAE